MGYIGCDTFTFQSVLVVEHFNKDLFEEPCDDDNANVPYNPDACMNHEFMGQAWIIEPTEEDQGLVQRQCWGSNRRNCMHTSFTGVASIRRNCMYVCIRVVVVLLLGTTTTTLCIVVVLLLLLLLE